MILQFFIILLSIAYQSGKLNSDNIGSCSYHIRRTASNVSNTTISNACAIRNLSIAETLFGPCDKSNLFHDELFNENLISIHYNDGLKLVISADHKRLFTFNITSSNYLLELENGKELKVGMTLEEIKNVFPKSYANRSIIKHWNGQEGNTQVIVYFSFIKEKVVIIEDSWLVFIFNKDSGKLEQFYSYMPG
jgi:hypothetical protein